MEMPPKTLSAPEQESTSSPSKEHNHHHRKNHRGGAKERARKERKISGPLTPSTPSSVTSPSVTGRKKHHHRAGVKYRAKRERQALDQMTSQEREATYDSEDDVEDDEGDRGDRDQHSERDTPSLTYDSDNHSEDHDDSRSEHEAPADPFSHEDVHNGVDLKGDIQSDEDTLTYQEKVEAEEEAVFKSGEEIYMEKTPVPPPPAVVETTKSQSPSVTLTPSPKQQVKQPIKLLSLMRPKVL